nr:external alternative NAD(P)H-ubiquinone oxidoreductase B1, mitochondrial-like [Nicotiana tomentosiformis]
MSGFTYLTRALSSHSSYSRLLLLSPVSTRGLLVYAESNVESRKQVVEENQSVSEKKRVVVLGTGWAGTSFLKDVDISSYDVQVVLPRNYIAFTPLLPSVTCGTV